MFDTEALFDRMAAAAWSDALDLVRQAPSGVPDDAVTRSALETLALEIGRRLETDDLSDDDVEGFLVLGRSGRIPVSRDLEGRTVETLLHRYRDTPKRALAVARFRPDLAGAISVLSQFGEPASHVRESEDGAHRVTTALPGKDVPDVGQSIFRSEREVAFFRAACRVYPQMLVHANVALHAALDFDRLRGRLTPDERTYFFRALVDCVIFDPEAGYRPVRFIEIDSPQHDDAFRRDRDGLKDRIVSLAGHHLVRIRPLALAAEDDVDAFERLLLSLDAGGTAYIPDGESRNTA